MLVDRELSVSDLIHFMYETHSNDEIHSNYEEIDSLTSENLYNALTLAKKLESYIRDIDLQTFNDPWNINKTYRDGAAKIRKFMKTWQKKCLIAKLLDTWTLIVAIKRNSNFQIFQERRMVTLCQLKEGDWFFWTVIDIPTKHCFCFLKC